MSIFTVHVPPGNDPNDMERAVFVRDGFRWAAALLAPLWLIWQRLWLEFALYLLGIALIGVAAKYLALPNGSVFWISLLVNLYIGFEASALLQGRLHRRGFAFDGVIAGQYRDEVERRYFSRPMTRLVESAAVETAT